MLWGRTHLQCRSAAIEWREEFHVIKRKGKACRIQKGHEGKPGELGPTAESYYFKPGCASSDRIFTESASHQCCIICVRNQRLRLRLRRSIQKTVFRSPRLRHESQQQMQVSSKRLVTSSAPGLRLGSISVSVRPFKSSSWTLSWFTPTGSFPQAQLSYQHLSAYQCFSCLSSQSKNWLAVQGEN